MKNKTSLFVIFGIVAIYIFILSLVNTNESNEITYSVFNSLESGTSLLYDVIDEMGYPVEIGYEQIDQYTNINDLQIVISPDYSQFRESEADNIMKWVENGGRLVLYEDLSTFKISSYLEAPPIETTDYYQYFQIGFGEVVIGDVNLITNQYLLEDSASGEYLVYYFDANDYENIIFNEYYHGFHAKPTMWEYSSTGFKMFSYQIAFICILSIWFLGKRFGKPIPYYAEIEREENEYVKELSIIYRNANMSDVALEYYYDDFLSTAAKYFGQTREKVKESIIPLWKEANLPQLSTLESVDKKITERTKFNLRSKSRRKQFLQMVQDINTLTNFIK